MPTVVFGMTVLAEAFTTGAFEPQCRGVEKRDRNGTEQRLAVAIERLFDRLRGAAAVATENRIRAGADAAMGYPRLGCLTS